MLMLRLAGRLPLDRQIDLEDLGIVYARAHPELQWMRLDFDGARRCHDAVASTIGPITLPFVSAKGNIAPGRYCAHEYEPPSHRLGDAILA